MKKENIKPIPKYIKNKIEKIDKTFVGKPGLVRYYSYLTKLNKELCKITVAVKYNKNKFYCKQVAIHGIKSEKCLVKDMEYNYLGGYVVSWYNEGITKYKKWYEGKWDTADSKFYNPYSRLINIEYLEKFEEFKYSGWQYFKGDCIIKYLKQYLMHPQIEYLIKAGLENLVFSKQIINKLEKDIKFRKWLFKNKEDLKYNTYIQSIITAYKNNFTIAFADSYIKVLKNAKSYPNLPKLAKDNIEKLGKYIAKNNTNLNTYSDYIRACTYLNINMEDTKNVFPLDFIRLHNIRIDQYASKKAEDDEKLNKEELIKFKNISNKYKDLELKSTNNYVCIIAKSKAELIKEGEILHHCVGRMNYDKKFTREESLIFFIRNSNSIETPLVTIEYNIQSRKVLQCYGNHDSTPDDSIIKFVYNKWLPYANRKLEKIVA